MSTTVQVKCDDSSHLYWREGDSGSWARLTSSKSSAPTIAVTSRSSITFEFYKYSGSDHGIEYKVSPQSSASRLHSSSSAPSVTVSSGDDNCVYFAKTSSNPSWYCGYVRVSDTSK
ncbi:hypothetical protein [Paraliomyxa miuraensis]|uniref:hypothetical protein n=1 Tax=Paraliomyxa miuraensis TaxID=376150 RepID=UPI002257D824|nr:hypothetical protein [Paraliomyxa miuraensis]MCX4247342.1 hypothetical protein [Paraliomyxa miuraensis]